MRKPTGRPRGRPTLPDGDKKIHVPVYLDPALLATVRTVAGDVGVSEWCRDVIRRAAARWGGD